MSLLSLSLFFVTIVGLAGAMGAATRYLLGRFVAERVNAQFPLGTLVINVTGAFLIGLLFALAGHKIISASQQAILATGFLGGYTTFSTMSWEGTQLWRSGRTVGSMLYLGGSIALGLVFAVLGLLAGGWSR